jgi:hypothetical protein
MQPACHCLSACDLLAIVLRLHEYFVIDEDQEDDSLFDVFDAVKFEGSVVEEQVLLENFDQLALCRERLIVDHDVHCFFELY